LECPVAIGGAGVVIGLVGATILHCHHWRGHTSTRHCITSGLLRLPSISLPQLCSSFAALLPPESSLETGICQLKLGSPGDGDYHSFYSIIIHYCLPRPLDVYGQPARRARLHLHLVSWTGIPPQRTPSPSSPAAHLHLRLLLSNASADTHDIPATLRLCGRRRCVLTMNIYRSSTHRT
jgi:hypothetical protein